MARPVHATTIDLNLARSHVAH